MVVQSPGGPTASIVDNYKVKATLLNPALTSHYVCKFSPPSSSYFTDQEQSFPGANYNSNQDLIELSCSEASLPGSSLMTNEINDDFTGVTERHAYRRQFDDRIDFTFYVDHDYRIINFFESWISYCGKEDSQENLNNRNYFYRFNFPDEYQTDNLYVTKFERDLGSTLEYRFIRAYPISITSMPISYDSSQLLKCTVSFTYSRYVRITKKSTKPPVTREPVPPPPPGNPSPYDPRNPNDPLGPIINPPVAGRPSPRAESANFIVARPTRTTEPTTTTTAGVPNIPTTTTGAAASRRRSGPRTTEVNQFGRPGLPIQPALPPYNKAAGTGAVISNTDPTEPDQSGTSSVSPRGSSSVRR